MLPQHKEQLRIAFDFFDDAGTGHIPAQEIKVALYAFGYMVQDSDVASLLRSVNVDVNGTIDFNEFYTVLWHKMIQKESRMESIRAFRQIDRNDKGYIDRDDLRAIADDLQLDLTDDELTEMITSAIPDSVVDMAKPGNMSGAADEPVVDQDKFMLIMKGANVY